jgi:maleamate amidohydrolase
MRIWDRFLTEADKDVFRASGTNATLGFGERPALLVVDVTYAYTGDVDEPILDSIAKWPNSCGPFAWAAIPHIQQLLTAFRSRGLPVFYSAAEPPRAGRGAGLWRNEPRPAASGAEGVDGTAIVKEIAPDASEVVIRKVAPSAFFGTHLRSYLTEAGADTVVVCGAVTSGCVRASVVDGFSHNLRMIVAEDATFDRGEASHAIGLFDMDAKYADVMPTQQILADLTAFG